MSSFNCGYRSLVDAELLSDPVLSNAESNKRANLSDRIGGEFPSELAAVQMRPVPPFVGVVFYGQRPSQVFGTAVSGDAVVVGHLVPLRGRGAVECLAHETVEQAAFLRLPSDGKLNCGVSTAVVEPGRQYLGEASLERARSPEIADLIIGETWRRPPVLDLHGPSNTGVLASGQYSGLAN